MDGNIDFLSKHALFGGLNHNQMEMLAPLLHKENFDSHVKIIHEGEIGDKVYFILKGKVSVLKKRSGSQKGYHELAQLKKGDTFGEMELIDIQPRAATIETLEPTHLLSFSNHDLYHLHKTDLMTFTMIIMNLAREISRRLRKMDEFVAKSIIKE